MVRDHDPDARPKLQRPADGRYTVHRGDTLIGIASTFGVDVEELASSNDLRNRNRLHVGQTLFIPGDVTAAGGRYVVQRGDSLERIARRYGVSLHDLERTNRIVNRNRIRVGQTLTIPGRDGAAPPVETVRYVVRRGDTLARIAARHGTTAEAIAAASGLRDRNRIRVGQTLLVPGGPELASAPAPPEPPPAAAAEAQAEAEPASIAAEAEAEPAAVAAQPDPVAEVLARAGTPPAEATPPRELATTAPMQQAEPPPPGSDPAPSTLPWAPRRYRVAADGSIVVRPEETLGHYADWLEIRTQRLRNLNGLRFGRALAIGKRVRLDFEEVDRAEFERRRIEHHRSLQTAFYDDFAVAGTEQHVMRRGETLWKISRGKYDVPVWLIQQYNPSLDVNALQPGMRIRIPKLEPRAKS